MSEVIKEITALDLAEKIESGAELEIVERIAAGAMIREHHSWSESRRLGGRKRSDTPSRATIWRDRKKAEAEMK
ncbi:MAG: hypothetical protein WA584_23305 [Pyrinomonadaceae bacterium]